MMNLKTYLSAQEISRLDFCKSVGASYTAVTRWLNGERSPSAAMMQKIFTATGGQVTPNDFFDLPGAGDEKKVEDGEDGCP